MREIPGEQAAWEGLDSVLDRVDALPPSPYPLPELFRALTDPDTDIGKVVEIISYDSALTARLLQLCNSAFISRGRPANTVTEAINRLGFHTVYRVVASIKGPQIFQAKGKAFGFSPEEIWKHSVMTALNAQFMGEDFGEDSGMLFTAGLLHDIGKVIMGMAFQSEYASVVSAARLEKKPLAEVEAAVFGFEHAALGARLLERWKFSPELAASVLHHHQPLQARPRERFPAIIQVASALSHEAYPETADRKLTVQAQEALDVFGWTPDEMRHYGQRMEEHKEIIKMLLRMGK